MADNVGILDAAQATVPVAADEIDGVQYQRMKLMDALADSIVGIYAGEGGKANALRVVLAIDAADVKVTLDSEPVVLGAGVAVIGKLAANSGVDIGDVDVTSLPALVAGSAIIGSVKSEPNAHTRVSARVALIAAQTGAAIWTPAAGKRFVLRKLVVSCKTAGDVEFFDGTDSGNTVIGPILTLAVGGGWTETWTTDEGPYMSAAVDNVLKYTSGDDFTGSAYVEGWEV